MMLNNLGKIFQPSYKKILETIFLYSGEGFFSTYGHTQQIWKVKNYSEKMKEWIGNKQANTFFMSSFEENIICFFTLFLDEKKCLKNLNPLKTTVMLTCKIETMYLLVFKIFRPSVSLLVKTPFFARFWTGLNVIMCELYVFRQRLTST